MLARLCNCFCCYEMEGGPQSGGLCQNTPRSAPAGGLTRERSDVEYEAKQSSEAHAVTQQQANLHQTSISHIRADASFTASPSSSESSSSPSPRILQPDSLRWSDAITLRGEGEGPRRTTRYDHVNTGR